MTLPENVLHQFATLVNDQTCNKPFGRLKVGVDLGTANIVLSVVDEKNQPVAGITYPSTIVKDGIVVDYPKASRIVTDLKEQLRKKTSATTYLCGNSYTAGNFQWQCQSDCQCG